MTLVVLVISARDSGREKIAALDLGASDYVSKPFDTGELLARIRVALRPLPQKYGLGTPKGGLQVDVTSREPLHDVVLDLRHRLGRDDDLAHGTALPERDQTVLELLLHLGFVPGEGVDDVPAIHGKGAVRLTAR